MRPIFAFAADLQARESAYKSNKDLKGDDLYALAQVVNNCIALSIPLILGGDQVDTPTIGDEHTVNIRKELGRMTAPVWYIDGNHERGFRRLSLEGGPAAVALNLEGLDLEIGGHSIKGFNWRTRKTWEEYLGNNKLAKADVVILHGFAEQVVASLGLPKGETPMSDFDLNWFDGTYKLALMGDIHMEWNYRGQKNTSFWYSGSMWMHRVGEPEEKSYILVYEDLSVKRVSLNCRPYLTQKVESISDLEKVCKWLDKVKKNPYLAAMELYMGSKLPRVHLVIPADMTYDMVQVLDKIEARAYVFKKVDNSHDQDLNEIKGSLEEKVDLDTALGKLLNSADAQEAEAIAFIKQAMTVGFDDAVKDLKTKLGV